MISLIVQHQIHSDVGYILSYVFLDLWNICIIYLQKYSAFNRENNFRSAGSCKLVHLQSSNLLLVYKQNVDSFLKLVNHCCLKQFVCIVESFTRTTPGRMDVNNQQLLVVLIVELEEVFFVSDGYVNLRFLLAHQLLI